MNTFLTGENAGMVIRGRFRRHTSQTMGLLFPIEAFRPDLREAETPSAADPREPPHPEPEPNASIETSLAVPQSEARPAPTE